MPMISARVLPPAEWERVAHLEPFASGGLPDPTHWRIVVVERDGEIVAMSSLFDTVHWDGFWVAAGERANPAIFGPLIAGGLAVMAEYDIHQVHTTVPTQRPDLAAMLERFGYTKVPGDLYFYTREKE